MVEKWEKRVQRLAQAKAKAATAEKPLTEAESVFVAEYVKTQSVIDAYRAAYPKSVRNATANVLNMNAQTVFRRQRVKDAIALFEAAKVDAIREEEQKRLIARHGRLAERVLTQDRVVGELHDIAYANIKDFLAFDENGVPKWSLATASDRQMASVAEIVVKVRNGADGQPQMDVRIKFHNKMLALKMLGDHLGMWPKDGGFHMPAAAGADTSKKSDPGAARAKLLDFLDRMAIPEPLAAEEIAAAENVALPAPAGKPAAPDDDYEDDGQFPR